MCWSAQPSLDPPLPHLTFKDTYPNPSGSLGLFRSWATCLLEWLCNKLFSSPKLFGLASPCIGHMNLISLSFLGFFGCSRSGSLDLASHPSLDINVALLSPGLVWILVIPDSKYKKHHMHLRKDLKSGVQSRGPHWCLSVLSLSSFIGVSFQWFSTV